MKGVGDQGHFTKSEEETDRRVSRFWHTAHALSIEKYTELQVHSLPEWIDGPV